MSDADLRAQYDAYPYPARDPRDEAKRLVTGSPSHLDELNHYVFGGRLFDGRHTADRPFRVLAAGGGTGDGTVMLAQQAADAGLPAEITYLDLSDAARAIAEARAAARGLTSVRFLKGSLTELPNAAVPGPFDYIDCCGVLHHLEDPAAGLSALVRVLAPGGGIGLMVYGRYGRAGVYPLQEALRTLTADMTPPERVALARRLLADLPATNAFHRNPFLGDHRESDAGLYELLLHSRDRAYTVPELAALADAAGLAITGLIEPARYDPRTYLHDPKLVRRLDGLGRLERAALAERIASDQTKHIAYATRPADADAAVARPAGPAMIPVLKNLDGKATARGLRPGAALTVELGGIEIDRPLPRLAGPMLARIDGRTDLDALYRDLAGLDRGLTWERFRSQFDQLYAALNGVNLMLLRRQPNASIP